MNPILACLMGLVVLALVRNIAALFTIMWFGYCTAMLVMGAHSKIQEWRR